MGPGVVMDRQRMINWGDVNATLQGPFSSSSLSLIRHNYPRGHERKSVFGLTGDALQDETAV